MNVVTEKVELRGITNKTTKNGNVYYMLNVEDVDGSPWQFYCPNSNVFPDGLKKGDYIKVKFDVRRYQGNDSLIVAAVEKVG